MANDKKLNREAWLNRLAEMLRPWFRKAGYTIHGRISVCMSTLPKNTLGQCRHQRFDKDAMMHHIFVSCYDDDHVDAADIGATLVHELLHSILPVGAKHGPLFKEGMAALKLAPPATATTAMPELRRHLETLIATMPPLPRYGILRPRRVPSGGGGGNKMFKFQCDDCKTTVYLKYTSLKRAGDPCCWNPDCDSSGATMDEQTVPDSMPESRRLSSKPQVSRAVQRTIGR